MPNGQQQEPGGWNRVVLKVADLPAYIAELKKAGLHFRNEMQTANTDLRLHQRQDRHEPMLRRCESDDRRVRKNIATYAVN